MKIFDFVKLTSSGGAKLTTSGGAIFTFFEPEQPIKNLIQKKFKD